MKRLFVIGASDFQLPAILTAKKMGLYVGVADMNPNAVGVPYADEFYNVSTIDVQGIYEAAKSFDADGIVTLCTDMPMRALAYSCEQLGLTGITQSTAITATDKSVMIKAFERCQVQHPSYVMVPVGVTFENIAEKVCYPAITKPTDNSGSRGIMLVRNEKELKDALEYSSKNGREGSVIVEDYMQGPEVSVEIMVVNGIPYVLQVTDKLTTGAPHFVEIGHSEPSRLPQEDVEAIKDVASRAALAVGIQNGPAHAEVILTSDGPKMVEIGARMGGGCITTHLVPLSTGIDMTKATIQTALGEIPDIEKRFDKGSAIRFIIPPIGIVSSISGIEEAKRIEGVQVVEVQCKPGQKLTELESGASRIGYVIAQAETPEEAVSICEKALKCIKIEIVK